MKTLLKPLLLLTAVLFFTQECRAEAPCTFGYDKISSGGITIPYRIAETGTSGSGKRALVLYLHGGSSKGTDNETQMSEAAIDSIAIFLDREGINALFVVPQCPSDKSWGGPVLGVLKALTDRYTDGGDADPSRIYLFGGSMGGTGTWSMLSAYPGLFAAAMPVAGNPSKCDAASVAKTPVFTVMGTADKLMNIDATAGFVDRLRAEGGEAMFETEEGYTHEMTCIRSYTSPRLRWVFSHEETPAGIESTVVESRRKIYFTTDGRPLSAPVPGQICIEISVDENGCRAARKIVL